MTEIRFYHLTRSTIEQALPDLLEKTLSRGWRALVRVDTESAVEPLSTHLWAYRKESFLPHGTAKAGRADAHPIWITADDENQNGAHVLFALGGAGAESGGDYALVCDLFDGNDTQSVAMARTRWGAAKAAGHNLTYWQQGEKGWTKKGE